MRDDPDRVGATVPRHVSHWRNLGCRIIWVVRSRTALEGCFQADDDQQPQRAVDADPFVREGLLAAHGLNRWSPQ